MAAALALVPTASDSLENLIDGETLWRGQSPRHSADAEASHPVHPTGVASLDAALPWGGWPESSLTELLLPADAIGELKLLWPTLLRLSRASEAHERPVVLIAPPYIPYAPAWLDSGVDLGNLHVIHAPHAKDALWAAEQSLRSGACSAVLCWPHKADDRALRRLQVAAQTGQALGFVFRDQLEARNPSPAALRLQLHAGASDDSPMSIRIIKCRGSTVPQGLIAV